MECLELLKTSVENKKASLILFVLYMATLTTQKKSPGAEGYADSKVQDELVTIGFYSRIIR